MQYRKLYQSGAEILTQAGIEEASLDARLLLEYVCHTDRNTLLAHGDQEVDVQQQAVYEELIAKRSQHIPLQHLTHVQEFMGLAFFVNEHVLIPRQDTEILAEAAMKRLHDGMELLDMCTGSGCILLSLLYYSNDCKGVGADISADALAVAQQNAEHLQKQKRISAEFLQSDLFDKIETGRKFDMLVSNPPYIRSAEIASLMEEVREHEPLGALDGMEDGLYFYRRISRAAKPYLYRGASLLFEIGYDQAQEVCQMLEAEGYREIEVIQDFAGLDRVVTCVFWE